MKIVCQAGMAHNFEFVSHFARCVTVTLTLSPHGESDSYY